ncbi:type I-C CRISPR-associated protein Cas8c/Csd1 [Paenibacillus sp. CAA11]|uniref:type I-C CRISPR-associated protein Cas8c/Csd1 n=1 Tax=Paenibacillus sp. CAA11 TaxID=1532905 RepID=UPI000D354CFF|nr:type I-C CRISPR-associated protein Cas8c/Csd1 [Paenibacillus sp. CAA11]AWB43161.1 type I-C CRISPR-associated protein Cas8c/Csd1 [Paenibacillus sp. CAA11]
MSWLANLNTTYEQHEHAIGQFEKKRNGREYTLIPVSHTTQTAHIEVHLDERGNYLYAKVVDKEDGSTIMPCTEASASRTSAPVPYPLFDKLMYVAGDYSRYCGEVKGTPYEDYLNQLKAWCDSSYKHPKVESVYHYIAKGTLMTDLIKDQILWVDEDNKLLKSWTSAMEEKQGEKPDIFKVIASDQSSAFVRFAVQIPGDLEPKLWRDRSVQQSFIHYYEQNLQEMDLCYVTGELLPYADKHASRIRHSGDKSKLISANDSSGFTYRGRFRTSREVASVSYEVSQKAHNALKWLIERQGFAVDGKVFLVWGTEKLDLPDPFADTFSLYGEEDEEGGAGDSTHKEFANQVRQAIGGYRFDGDYKSNVIVMVLDAATPGRMSIVYYQELNHRVFLDKLQHWHESCSWQHRYRKDQDNKPIVFIGAPATRDIALAAYGSHVSDKLVKGLMERMLPCIIEGRPIPMDIVRSAINRASNPVAMDSWEWEKALGITCAVVNKTFEKEGYEVSLNTETTDRNYLFGRLLAIADVLERRALGRDEKRATNAIRYMNVFAQRPTRTWSIIQSNIQPYQARLGTELHYYNRLLDEVGGRIQFEDFTDKPLNGLYLLGFYSQRNDLYTSKKDKNDGAEEQAQIPSNPEEEGEN